jgi:hyaluronoglucosaminidase
VRLGRGSRTATAVAAAVMGSLLGGAPSAYANPGDPAAPGAFGPAGAAGSTAAPRGQAAVPAVWPRPQSLRAAGESVPLGAEVTLLADPSADHRAVALAREVLGVAGVGTVHTSLPGRGPVLHLDGPGAAEALRSLRAPERADLPAGGYRLAAGRAGGRGVIAVEGAGVDGLFHGVQTLRQLVTGAPGAARSVPGVLVRDWPGTAVRGMTEGFYGEPWTHEERLSQLDFLGSTKQNRYLYAPGDDPFRQARWREPYPADRRAEFRELAARAAGNHVTLGWAVAPAQEMCLSDERDLRALLRKVDGMRALGVGAFQLQFQDVSYSEWHCSRDRDEFGRGPAAAARAHARVAGALARHLAERHPDAEPLSVMPTEYYQDGATEYRTALAKELDPSVQVAWTGVGVVPGRITGRELADARRAFGERRMVTMDNYPVNDYAQDRLFLGPYTGREPAVAAGSAALLANAMEQPYASRIALFTSGDYAWNPKAYRSQESWQAALDRLAGGDAEARRALGAVAGNHTSSILQRTESAYLKPLFEDYWTSRTGTDAAAKARAAATLRTAFTGMREATGQLAGTGDGRLDEEIRPWLDQLARFGRAGELAVDLLQAQNLGDGATAWRLRLELERVRAETAGARVVVGKGVLDPFLDRVTEESERWTGAARFGAPGADGTLRLGRARLLSAVTAMTEPAAGTDTGTETGTAAPAGRLEAHVPGEGWRELAPLEPGGWTQSELRGVWADAVRVVAPGGGRPAGVRAVVPWFTDEPAAGLDLARGETDVELGSAQTVEVTLAARRAEPVREALRAEAPDGIAVRVPGVVNVPRGQRVKVPVTVSAAADTPAGEYRVRLLFAGEERTLTVRAYPRAEGPDLARAPGAAAESSGDETADFPASAALDDASATRWSSRYEDGAWWQLRLAAPARVGRVVLHWQDAYASRYRVQVSADGRTWRTAATVRDGRGGRETVLMDAAETRFVRVQGDERATRFGYSLWSVEAYAIPNR